MQGTQNNTAAGGALDLDALLAGHRLEPAQVRLAGRTWKVRTDLTGTEVVRALAFYNTNDFPGLLTLLVGTREEIAALNAAMDERRAVELAAADAKERGDTEARVTYAPLPYGKRAVELAAVLDGLPRMHLSLATANIFRASKALAEFALSDEQIERNHNYQPGESSAS